MFYKNNIWFVINVIVIMQENMHSSNSTQNNVLWNKKKVIKSKQLNSQFE